MKPILCALLLLLGRACPLGAEAKLALLGPFAEEKSVELLAAQKALDANNALPGAPRLKLAVFNGGATEAGSLEAAKKLAADPEVLAVVLHGEAAAAPSVLAALRQAGLAVVSASSWAQPRAAEAGPTWLCPGLGDIAEDAAFYARRQAHQSQVAVVDDGAATSNAAAKAFAARFRALGGKVPYEGTWQGSDEALAEVVRGMDAHWPQMVFYAGDGASAGRLVVAMKAEKALRDAGLLGLPSLFEPAFFDTARLKSSRTWALFPCPDFPGTGPLTRFIGFAFPRTSAEYKAYVSWAFNHPGRWTSMIFDAVALAARAVRGSVSPGLASAKPAPSPAAQSLSGAATTALSPSAAAISATAAVEPAPTSQPQAAALPLEAPLTRAGVAQALAAIDGYRGIRGVVKFGPSREPVEPKVMVYYALNKVNKKEMAWKEKTYGPPF